MGGQFGAHEGLESLILHAQESHLLTQRLQLHLLLDARLAGKNLVALASPLLGGHNFASAVRCAHVSFLLGVL
jgi:hypothetical protein